MTDERQFSLPDADGSETSFTGVLLGSGTSARPGAPRWSEVNIYRTAGGTYLVHKIGRTTKTGETDRFTLHVSEAAEGAVESCKTSDAEGGLFFTRVARDALMQATVQDPDLYAAFYHRKLA